MDLEGHVATGGDAIRAKRHLLLPALWAAQSREGWISPGALNYICQRLSVAPADAWGVATFYAMFSVAPAPKTIVHVCDDIACRLAGGPELLAQLRRRLPNGAAKPSPVPRPLRAGPGGARPDVGRRGEGLRGRPGGGGCPASRTAPDERSPRSGLPFCAPDPGRPAREAAPARPGGTRRPRKPSVPEERRIRRAREGFRARAREHRARGARVEARRPRRRGLPDRPQVGGRREAPAQPHYVICNADESEPGTFKDRVAHGRGPVRGPRGDDDRGLRDRRAHGYIYMRGEYALAIELAAAIAAATKRGSWARASPERTTPSTSRSAAAPEPTSAAKRQR